MDTDKKPETGKENEEPAPASAEAGTPAAASPAAPVENKPGDGANSSDTPSDKANTDGTTGKDDVVAKPPNSFKQTLKRFRVYVLILLLLAIVGIIFVVVSSLNGKKTPPPPSVSSQPLSQTQLKKLASSTTSSNGQTLTVRGDATLNGQVLIRNNLGVAGTIQLGSGLNVPKITDTNTSSFGSAQASTLQIATSSTFQGVATFQDGINMNGNTAFNAATIGTLTATNIVMSGSMQIEVPGHLAFTGAFPGRTINFGVLGNGGSASLNGSDTSGTVSINTGNNPTAGCFISIIFNIPFTTTPNILLGPIGLGAGATQHNTEIITNSTSGLVTGFKICTANTPLPNQAFGFSYFINDSPT